MGKIKDPATYSHRLKYVHEVDVYPRNISVLIFNTIIEYQYGNPSFFIQSCISCTIIVRILSFNFMIRGSFSDWFR